MIGSILLVFTSEWLRETGNGHKYLSNALSYIKSCEQDISFI